MKASDPLAIALDDVATSQRHLESVRSQLREAESAHDEFVNEILDKAPEEWDDDVAGEAIALYFLEHLVDEVKRLGGCLKPWCSERRQHPEDVAEPCDHGYPAGATA